MGCAIGMGNNLIIYICNRCKVIAAGSPVLNTVHISSASNCRLYNQKTNTIYPKTWDGVETETPREQKLRQKREVE